MAPPPCWRPWAMDYGERLHDAVGVLLTNLRGQNVAYRSQCYLRESGTTGLLPNDIQHRVDELGTLSIVTLRPIVSRTSLAENKVVGPEQLPEGPGRPLSMVPGPKP